MANATLTYSLDTPSAGVATITGRSSSGAEDLVIPATIGGQNVVAIAESAFSSQSDLISLDLSGATNLLTIGNYAFNICYGFTGSLTIGNSVTSIGYATFAGCSGFTGSLTIGNSVTSIGYNAFAECSGFTGSLTIGNSVTSIGDYVFTQCSGFTGNLTIGNSVTSIGYATFAGCSGFTGSLTIGSSVTSIGDSAFTGCSGFTGNLTIPNSVTSIGESAFSSCTGFTSIWLKGNAPTLGTDAFTGITPTAFFTLSGTTGYEGFAYPIAQVQLVENPASEVKEGVAYGINGRLTGTLKSGGGINGSSILGII
jgi:hypothetical protein